MENHEDWTQENKENSPVKNGDWTDQRLFFGGVCGGKKMNV